MPQVAANDSAIDKAYFSNTIILCRVAKSKNKIICDAHQQIAESLKLLRQMNKKKKKKLMIIIIMIHKCQNKKRFWN